MVEQIFHAMFAKCFQGSLTNLDPSIPKKSIDDLVHDMGLGETPKIRRSPIGMLRLRRHIEEAVFVSRLFPPPVLCLQTIWLNSEFSDIVLIRSPDILFDFKVVHEPEDTGHEGPPPKKFSKPAAQENVNLCPLRWIPTGIFGWILRGLFLKLCLVHKRLQRQTNRARLAVDG